MNWYLVEALYQIYHPVADLLRVEKLQDLLRCIHGVPWLNYMRVDRLHIVHHPDLRVTVWRSRFLHKESPAHTLGGPGNLLKYTTF